MKRLKSYVNQLVNITIKVNGGHSQSISGHVTTVGKEYILFLDQDGKERPFKRAVVARVEIIKSSAKVKAPEAV